MKGRGMLVFFVQKFRLPYARSSEEAITAGLLHQKHYKQ